MGIRTCFAGFFMCLPAVGLLAGCASGPAAAQPAAAAAPHAARELERLVAPYALYPDSLVAVILPASTYPLQIVMAARFLDRLESDGGLRPDEGWDESVVALLNYPEIVRMMDRELSATWRLGEAVLGRRPQVLAAVAAFRRQALEAGNLASDEFQTVTVDGDSIEIRPADEETVRVPRYAPREVVTRQRTRVYGYHPTPRPLYYYPYPRDYPFSSRHFWGVTTAYGISWPDFNLRVFHPSYLRHPYYGRRYYDRYGYRRYGIADFNRRYAGPRFRGGRDYGRLGGEWRADRRGGPRPAGARRRYGEPAGSAAPERAPYSARGSVPDASAARSRERRERYEASWGRDDPASRREASQTRSAADSPARRTADRGVPSVRRPAADGARPRPAIAIEARAADRPSLARREPAQRTVREPARRPSPSDRPDSAVRRSAADYSSRREEASQSRRRPEAARPARAARQTAPSSGRRQSEPRGSDDSARRTASPPVRSPRSEPPPPRGGLPR